MIPLIITVHCLAPGEWRSNADLHVSGGQQGTGSPVDFHSGFNIIISLGPPRLTRSSGAHPLLQNQQRIQKSIICFILYLICLPLQISKPLHRTPAPILIVYFVTHAAKICVQLILRTIKKRKKMLLRLRIKFKLIYYY